MTTLERVVNTPAKVVGSCLVEPMEIKYEDSISSLEAESALEQFKVIPKVVRRYLEDFLDKLSYFSFGYAELKRIFPTPDDIPIEDTEIFQLALLNAVQDPFFSIFAVLDDLPPSFRHLATLIYDKQDFESQLDQEPDEEGHLWEQYSPVSTREYSDADIEEELQLVGNQVKEIFQYVNTLHSLLADKEAIWNEYWASVEEFGKEKFKEGVLKFLKEEYGYDDLADSLMGIDSFSEIHQKLTTAKARDLPLAELYAELKQKLKEGGSRVQLSNWFKRIKEETKQMKRELKHVAEYFRPGLDHYFSLERACKDLLVVMEDRFTKDEYSSKERILIADSTYSPGEDFNAGNVSRDCTAGMPLPFYHPQVHNVKLYFKDKSHNHIGNVYIIEGKTQEGAPFLHIEAFQCPYFTSANASAFLDVFLPGLMQAYEQKTGKKGLVITMNKKASHKSNQLPIRGVMKGRKAGENTLIQYPLVEIYEGFLSFQGGEPGQFVEKEILYR